MELEDYVSIQHHCFSLRDTPDLTSTYVTGREVPMTKVIVVDILCSSPHESCLRPAP